MLVRTRKVENARLVAVLVALLAALLAAGVLALVAARPAEAAFPGKNGRIFFQSNRDGNPHIYSMNPDGTDLQRLTFTGANSDPAVSPDGTRIAFVSSQSNNDDIWVMNADGSGQTQLTNTNSAEQNPTWSPDGTRIAYASNTFAADGQTDLEILVIDANSGGAPTQLTHNSYPDHHPAWSIPLPGNPDGMIAFVSTRAGDTDRNIYLMNTDGTVQSNLTPSGEPHGDSIYKGHDDDPHWTPYGRIAYVHTFEPNASGPLTIWAMNPDGSTKSRLTEDGNVSSTMPAWSPDGTMLAFVGALQTNRNIWVMNADGTEGTPIDTSPAHDINPDWQQDSIPPNVKSVSPTGKKVPRKANVTATFSEPMDEGTVEAAGTFALKKKGSAKALSATVTYDPATKTVTLDPAKRLRSGATYMAKVTPAAKDSAGNALDQNSTTAGNQSKSWRFKVK